MTEEEKLKQAESYLDGYKEFVKVTEAFLNGIADEIRSMQDEDTKNLLWRFFRKHTTAYGQNVSFLQELYNPQNGGKKE